MPNFEIKDKDLSARIGKLTTKHGKIETPAILPVVNPNRLTVSPREIERIGAQAIITNAYILWRSNLHEVVSRGLHDFLDFPGPIMTDSGAYQLMEYGEVTISNEEVIEFQEKINTDIGVILDVPTASTDRRTVEKAVEKTIERSNESQELIRGKETLYAGPLQGWRYPDLFEKCIEAEKDTEYSLHAIGSVVPAMERYNYDKLVKPMAIAKKKLPEDKPIHLFGAGHPSFLPFAVAMGMDLFDSAAYSLYAQDGRYITPQGTERVKNLDYLPCECPICSENTPEDLLNDTCKLAKHNLHVTMREMKRIKQAIKDKTLYELLETRSRAHPALKKLMDVITTEGIGEIGERDPVSKKHMFIVSEYSKRRPDYTRAFRKANEITGEKTDVLEFGEVPKKIVQCYPYSHMGTETPKTDSRDIEKVKGASEYWLDRDIVPKDVKIEKSVKTGRIRNIKWKESIFAVMRANDFMILLHEGAKELHKKTKYPEKRIVVDSEAEGFVKKGESIFNKFVIETDPSLKPGQPVIIVNEDDELLAAGETHLSAKEIMDFDRGEAAKNRWSIEQKDDG